MDLIEYYLSASRIALQAKCTDPTTWREMYTVMKNLHDNLSCQVCHKLLDQPNSYINGVVCIGCVNYQLTEDITNSILKCYKEMCAYIQKSPLYNIMCTRDEDHMLVQLLTEVIGVCRPTNSQNDLVNGTINIEQIEEVNNLNKSELNISSDIQYPIKNQNEFMNLQLFNVQSQKHRIQNQTTRYVIPRKKKNERRWGCRCGNATPTPGKLTCFGQRCPCYTEQKSCERCKCRGCRNPRQKPSNADDNLEINKIRRKPVTLELVSSLKPSHIKSRPAFNSYTSHDMLQFPSPSQNYDQGGIEISLGYVNSIFHSP